MATADQDEQLAQEKRLWKEQRKALLPLYLAESALALLVTVGVLYGGYYMCDSIPTPKSAALEDKLIYLIRWCVFPSSLCLLWAIVAVSNKRGSSTAINPLAGKEHLLQVEKNILANTLEQCVLFLMICLVLTTYLEGSELRILPVYSFLWVIGRILFAVGYKIHPKYRSVGMLSTFLALSLFFVYIVYLMYTRGFMYGVETETRRGDIEELASPPKAEL